MTETIVKGSRESLVKKKPKFVRQESWSRKRLSRSSWRKTRGRQSKMRLRHASKHAIVQIGYKSALAIRGTLKDGRTKFLVKSVSDLQNIPTNAAVYLAANIGLKKSQQLITEAKKLNILFENATEEKIHAKITAIQTLAKEKREKKRKKEKVTPKKETKTKDAKPEVKVSEKKSVTDKPEVKVTATDKLEAKVTDKKESAEKVVVKDSPETATQGGST